MDLLDDDAKRAWQDQDPALSYEVDWTSLEEQLCFAENHGINEKVASYIGATTLRASCRCLRGPALIRPRDRRCAWPRAAARRL